MTPAPSQSIICPNCTAANPADATICRRCELPLPTSESTLAEDSRQAALRRMREDPSHGMQFSLSSVLIGLTVVAILFGIMAQMPGIGMLIAFCCLPAFIRTSLLIRKRERMGRPTSTERKVLSFVGSIVFALITSAVVLIASVGTFCTICLTGGTKGGDSLIIFSGTVALVVTLVVAYFLFKWSRSRWWRDVFRD
jgi:hypothetical protein